MRIRIRLEGGSGTKRIVTRRQLTDEQWKLIEPFLPIGEYGPYPERLREQFEGVIWRFRTSSQWREMPGEFGPWPTVYGRFRVWRDAGVFTAMRVHVDLEVAAGEQTAKVVNDYWFAPYVGLIKQKATIGGQAIEGVMTSYKLAK